MAIERRPGRFVPCHITSHANHGDKSIRAVIGPVYLLCISVHPRYVTSTSITIWSLPERSAVSVSVSSFLTGNRAVVDNTGHRSRPSFRVVTTAVATRDIRIESLHSHMPIWDRPVASSSACRLGASECPAPHSSPAPFSPSVFSSTIDAWAAIRARFGQAGLAISTRTSERRSILPAGLGAFIWDPTFHAGNDVPYGGRFADRESIMHQVPRTPVIDR